ncbi:MAG: hypothetical protein V3W36_02655 [Acidimicrobiia bacterium]
MTTLRAIRVETASFDVEGLRQILDGDHADLRREVRSLLETFDRPPASPKANIASSSWSGCTCWQIEGSVRLVFPDPMATMTRQRSWAPFPAPIGLPMEVD